MAAKAGLDWTTSGSVYDVKEPEFYYERLEEGFEPGGLLDAIRSNLRKRGFEPETNPNAGFAIYHGGEPVEGAVETWVYRDLEARPWGCFAGGRGWKLFLQRIPFGRDRWEFTIWSKYDGPDGTISEVIEISSRNLLRATQRSRKWGSLVEHARMLGEVKQ